MLHRQPQLCPEISFRFAVLISGYPSRAQVHQSLLYGMKDDASGPSALIPIPVPTLHVIGRKDELVTPDRSRGLLPLFDQPELYEHDGG